jgi:hypothetical protein
MPDIYSLQAHDQKIRNAVAARSIARDLAEHSPNSRTICDWAEATEDVNRLLEERHILKAQIEAAEAKAG